MDLIAYLEKHDGKIRSHGAELLRLAAAVELSPYYLYLVARGHKRVSPAKAKALAEQSLDGELLADGVNRPKPARAEVAA